MKFNETRPLYILKEIASILRGENGCAWDRDQTSKTLKPYLIEEAYEVHDAIDDINPDNLKEELGDLIYQVYAHAQIAEENENFTIDDVARGIIEKLIRRHPHVFGDESVSDKYEVIDRWEKIKKKEKSHRQSILDGVPKHMPALLQAYRIQQKVSRIGFDWDIISDINKKLDEEIEEFKQALLLEDSKEITDEIGDILFTIVNISRFIKINPEEALRQANNKFKKRFKLLEGEIAKSGKEIENMSIRELDMIWERVKEASPE